MTELVAGEEIPDFELWPAKCSECGEPAQYISETIAGNAELRYLGRGKYGYAGSTEVIWDTQTTVENADGSVELICYCGHIWKAYPREARTRAGRAALALPKGESWRRGVWA